MAATRSTTDEPAPGASPGAVDIPQAGGRPTDTTGDRAAPAHPSWAAPWRAVVLQTVGDLWRARALEWASSLAFYCFLSSFPLFLVVLIAASWLVDAGQATRHAADLLGYYVPGGDAEIRAIIERAMAARGRAGAISILLFLLTGRRILGVLTTSLNHVSDVDEHADNVPRRIAVEGALLLGVVAVVLGAFAAPLLLGPAEQGVRAAPGPDGVMVSVAAVVVRALLLMGVFELLYAFVPRGERRWAAVGVGAATATILFVLTQGVYGLLVDRIWDSLRLVYGPLALAALLLSWAWYVALITLACGGLASHVKVIIVERRSRSEAQARHETT